MRRSRRRRTKAQKIWKILNNPQFTGASGNRSKLAIAALVYSILMVLSTFAPAALEWGVLFSMAFASLLLTFAALYVTRPGGKVTGQLFAWIAAVLTVLGFVIGSVGIVVSGALEKAAPPPHRKLSPELSKRPLRPPHWKLSAKLSLGQKPILAPNFQPRNLRLVAISLEMMTCSLLMCVIPMMNSMPRILMLFLRRASL